MSLCSVVVATSLTRDVNGGVTLTSDEFRNEHDKALISSMTNSVRSGMSCDQCYEAGCCDSSGCDGPISGCKRACC